MDPDVGYVWNISGGNSNLTWGLISIQDVYLGINLTYFILEKNTLSYKEKREYILDVSVYVVGRSDLNSSASYKIIVSAVNVPPVVRGPIPTLLVNETASIGTEVGDPILQYTINDNVNNKSIAFYISDYGSDRARTFSVEEHSGQLILQKQLYPIYVKYFHYQITVYDTLARLSCTANMSIVVVPILQPPYFTNSILVEGEVLQSTVYKNETNYVSKGGAPVTYMATDNHLTNLVFRVMAVDGDVAYAWMFYVETGSRADFHLVANTTFNFKKQPRHSVIVQASNGKYDVNATVYVNVVDADSSPYFNPPEITCYIPTDIRVNQRFCAVEAQDGDDLSQANGWGKLTYSLLRGVDGLNVSSVQNVAYFSLTSMPTWLAVGSQPRRVLVKAMDGGGLWAVATVTLISVSTEATPSCPSLPMRTNVSENATLGSVVFSVFGSFDSRRFIHGVGDLLSSAMTVQIVAGNAYSTFSIDPN
eukprot:gene9733-12491_t